MLGTALAIKMVAYVGVSPVMAAATTRLRPRTLLIATDAVRATIALALPFVESVWQIYVLVFLLQAASATFTPAYQAVIASVLTDEDTYTAALSLSRLAYDLGIPRQPDVGRRAADGGELSRAVRRDRRGIPLLGDRDLADPTARGSSPKRASNAVPRPGLGGAHIMWTSTELRALLALNVVVASATALVVVNTVIYVRTLLDGDDRGLALTLACFGGGSMLAALALPACSG